MLYSEAINSISDLLGWGQISAITDTPTTEIRKVVRALNHTLSAMQNDRDWPELNTRGVLSISAPVTENSIANVTKGSLVLTLAPGSTLVFAATDVGKTVEVAVHPANPPTQFTNGYYLISEFTNVRSVKLDRVWASDSILLGDISVCSMQYPLTADYDRILGGELTNAVSGNKIYERSPSEMKEIIRDNGTVLQKLEASNYTVHGLDSSGKSILHFDTAFPTACSIEYSYQKKHPAVEMGATKTDGSILYPERLSLYIIDQVVARLNRDVENNAMVQQQASDAYKEAVRANSNPATGRERTVMSVQSLRHGAYRRR